MLIALAIAAIFTSLALIKLFSEVILPALFPPPSPELIYPPPIMAEPPTNAPSLVFAALYNLSPYLVPITWIVFVLILWKGRIRILWQRKGYNYDTFKIFAKMRGSYTRVRILKSLQMPKNRLQLAKELEMHWESIDRHTDVLIRYSLVKEVISFGTSKYLMITERGKELLELLENSKADPT